MAAALLVTGCGASTPEPQTADVGETPPVEDTGGEAQAPAPGELLIYEFQMGDHTGDDVMLHDDGRLTSERLGQDLGVLRSDGRFSAPNGTVLATLQADGNIVLADGTEFELMITADETLRHRVNQHLEIRISGDGTIVGFEGGQAGDEGFGSVIGFVPAGRRTALFILAIAAQLLGAD